MVASHLPTAQASDVPCVLPALPSTSLASSSAFSFGGSLRPLEVKSSARWGAAACRGHRESRCWDRVGGGDRCSGVKFRGYWSTQRRALAGGEHVIVERPGEQCEPTRPLKGGGAQAATETERLL